MKEKAAFHFLLGSHLILLLHLIRVTTDMTFNTHRTLSPDLLFHGMVHSIMGVSLHSFETSGKHVFVKSLQKLGPDGKTNIFRQWMLEICSLKSARKTHWFIFLFITTVLLSIWNFWKKQAACHLKLWSRLTALFHLIRVTGMAVNTHRTFFSLWPFFHGLVQWVLQVFTQLWNCRETYFFEPGIWGMISKAVFSTCESRIVATSHLQEKYAGWFFSSLQQQFWSSIWVLLKKQASCHFLLRSHLRVQFQLIRVTIGMVVSTHRILSPDLFSHGILQCILGVSLHNSHMQAKLVFSLCNSLIVSASNWTEKHPGSYFSS